MTTQRTYIGTQCFRGHSGLRYERTGNCVHCHKMFAAERARQRYRKNPERHIATTLKYNATERGKKRAAEYNKSQARRDALRKYNHSEKGLAAKQRYSGSKKQKDAFKRAAQQPKARLARALRDRIRKIIKRGKGVRAGSAVADLGCSLDQFKQFIEAKFLPGMSWDNYGSWHLDHIKPLRLFDLTIRNQFLEACNYKNYQPLWALDNVKKGDFYAEAA